MSADRIYYYEDIVFKYILIYKLFHFDYLGIIVMYSFKQTQGDKLCSLGKEKYRM